MSNYRYFPVLTLAAAIAILGSASAAKAEILAAATRTSSVLGGGPAATIMPLTDQGSKALAFSTSVANQTVVIEYNAECQARGGGYTSVSIFVDGVQANPASGSQFALCTTDGSFTGAVRRSVLVVAKAGTHSVTVQAQSSAVGTNWSLDDTSLTVEK